LGEVRVAVEFAEKSGEYADKSGDEFERMSSCATYADALCQAGDVKAAKEKFEEAERMQAEMQPEHPLLYSLWGCRYCDLLLGEGEYDKVLDRARYMLDLAEKFLGKGLGLIDIGLGRLSIGIALMGLAADGGGDWEKAVGWLDKAVDGLRESGNQDEIPRGLLARGAMYRHMKNYEKAWRDLDEVYEIAERGGMKLHLVDHALEAGRVCAAQGKKEDARGFYEKAKKLVEETGYHRRDGEVI
jgi:tetratricopeptide (TPR) repeat protein